MDTEYRKQIARRLRNNAGEDLSWLVPWAVFNDGDEHSPVDVANALADAIDPAGPEAVRCRDCVHFRPENPNAQTPPRCDGVFTFVKPDPDGFCSWGRKDDE